MHPKLKMICTNFSLFFSSLFWKRDPRIVLVGAWFGHKFADNSRYLYQYLSENKEKLGLTHVVWVTRNQSVCDMMREMGYEAYMMDSKESLYYHKKAGMHIICNAPYDASNNSGDILGRYSYGAKRINLCHGCGALKGVVWTSADMVDKRKKHPVIYGLKSFLIRHCKFHRLFIHVPGGWGECYYVSPSVARTTEIMNNFQYPQKNFIQSAFPRNSVCPRTTAHENDVIELIKGYDHILLYMPTFRKEDSKFDFANIATKLEPLLKEHNILWIQKAHSADHKSRGAQMQQGNVLTLDPNYDTSTIMPHIALLITDYSSARTDAMYYDKPVMFYVPDLEEYKTKDRGFIVDPDDFMCGPKVFCVDELRDGIRAFLSAPDACKTESYETIKQTYWESKKTLEEIWQDIKNYTEK